MQKLIDTMNQAHKNESAKEYNLGRFIKELKELDQEKLIYVEKNIGCEGLSSWRGSYCELALDYEKGKKSKVKEVLKNAKDTLDKILTGYKGGDFVMDKNTPIHIANYGETSFNFSKYKFKFNKSDKEFFHYQVKLIGIEDKGKYYQLKLRIDDSSYDD